MAEDGIIPAYAGLTILERVVDVAERDHPRLRGVNWSRSTMSPAADGSSPLTRG